MSSRKSYAVLGLGRYGRSVALELVAGGADVLAVDCNEANVNAVAGDIPLCKCADTTDPDVLRQLDIPLMQTATHFVRASARLRLAMKFGLR